MRANPGAIAIARLDVPAATLDRYRGVLVARRASVERLEGLKGQERKLRYAEVLPGSTSGALVQADMLRRLGVERDRFAALLSSGTHEVALADLLAGRADVAALAEEPWRKLRASDPEAASRLIELWRSPPLPSAPIVCVRSAATACDTIGAALLRSRPESAAAARGLAAGWSEFEGAAAFAPPQA
jgi:ABC-type phosphate/phosphonate transport system substrate-binding protein